MSWLSIVLVNVGVLALVEVGHGLIPVLDVLVSRHVVLFELVQDLLSVLLVFSEGQLVLQLLALQLGAVLSGWRLRWRLKSCWRLRL